MKPADEYSFTFFTFSGKLASSVQSPFTIIIFTNLSSVQSLFYYLSSQTCVFSSVPFYDNYLQFVEPSSCVVAD